MDHNDILNIEIWEKKVIGSDVCFGRVTLMKSSLPTGTPNEHGYWSPYITLPLQPPRDRKTKHSVGDLSRGSNSGSLSRDFSSTPHDLLESSSEHAPSRGTITLRVNYESRHQEWMALAPLRGQFFIWGAVHSHKPEDLVLVPELVRGLEDVFGSDGKSDRKLANLSMNNGAFFALFSDHTCITFGISYAKIAEGENACFVGPQRSLDSLDGEKIVSMASGIGHFLLLTQSGHVYSLGLNSRGELGLGLYIWC